jgi:ATP-dependent RNA helicase DeaD
MTQFKDFPLLQPIQKALDTLGFTQPTDIQVKAFQHLLTPEKVDFHGQAQTGTGKTLAFGIPLIQSVNPQDKSVQALVVAPTRELVVQICDSLKSVARDMGIYIEPIYGGMSMEAQIRCLKRGTHIVVGTPGRLNDHLRRKTLSLKNLRTLVLDEADIMLDMGFKEEIDEILAYAPKERQVWLFSATVKDGIRAIKETQMRNPVTVRVAAQTVTGQTTKQQYCVVPRKTRMQALARFIDCAPEFYGVVFCQTKMLANDLAQDLSKRGYSVNALHGDMNQAMRNKVIHAFKNKEFSILMATDVAARGIDVQNLTHVINFSLPEDQESYVHRIGRTGRAGKEGIAITFLNGSEVRRFQQLAKRFNAEIFPVDVPSADDVAAIRMANVMEQVDELCTRAAPATRYSQQVSKLLHERSKEELLVGMQNLLSDTLLKGFGNQEDEIRFESTESASRSGYHSEGRDGGRFEGRRGGFDRGGRRDRGGDTQGQEIMLNIGSDDGVTKQDVLKLLTSTQTLRNAPIGRIHVIKRRCFVTVSPDIMQALIAELRGKVVKGRQVRASVA